MKPVPEGKAAFVCVKLSMSMTILILLLILHLPEKVIQKSITLALRQESGEKLVREETDRKTWEKVGKLLGRGQGRRRRPRKRWTQVTDEIRKG